MQGLKLILMKKILLAFALFLSGKLQAQTNFALNFNGTNQDVSIGSPIPSSSSYTKEAWIYATTGSGPRNIISSFGAPFWVNGGSVQAGHGGVFNYVSDPSPLTLNTWVHLAVTYNSATTTMVLYRNGVAVSTNTSVPNTYVSEPTFIGSHTGAVSYFQGNIDEVRIWSRALTATELKSTVYRGPAKTATNLTRLYKFNEGSGSTLVDSTSTLDGTLNNSPAWVASPIQASNNSLNFDGINDNVVLPHSVSGSFTIEYWMNTTSTGSTGTHWFDGDGIVDAEVGTLTNDWGTSLYGNNLAFGLGDPDITLFSTSSVNTGTWTHVAASWNQGTGEMKLYINGVEEASGTGSTVARSAAPRITLGQIQTDINYYQGSIDELRIWNGVRTSTQIMDNMNNEINPASEPSLIAYYTFNQGITSGTNTGIDVLIDMKNTNNGTINNFARTGTTSNFIGQFAGITPLSLTWLDLRAWAQQGHAVIEWKIAGGKNTAHYEIQHSLNGNNWQKVGALTPLSDQEKAVQQFRFVHLHPRAGANNYYRIVQHTNNGKENFSNTRTVWMGEKEAQLRLSNPAVYDKLDIIAPMASQINLRDLQGRMIWNGQCNSGFNSYDLSALPKGLYILHYQGENYKISIQ